MKMRWPVYLLILAMLLGLMAGCGGQAAPSAATAPESASAGEAAPQEAAAQAENPAAEAAPAEAEPAASATEEVPGEPEDAPDYREPLSYPLADGSVTFTILHNEPALGPMTGQMNMSTYGDFESIALGTEAIGVTPEWTSLSAWSGDTQFNLVVASGDYPDVFTSIDKYYTGSFAKALEDEVIVTIDPELMAENMPEYWNLLEDDPDLKRAVTVEDGEFAAWYSIFDKQIVNEGYFIRKDLLDKLGMGIPESVNQLNDFAYAAKSEFGLQSVMMMASDLAVMSEAFGLGSASAAGTGTTVATGAGFSYHREGDQIVADITSERYQTYVEQLHQWYADGIVSQNFTELDSGNFSGDMEAELAADRTVICKTLVNSWDNLITLNPDPDFELSPMVVTMDGGNVHSGRGERQFDSSSLSSTCDPELYPYILGWMNYWYTEEGAMLGNYGIQGVDYDYDENGNIYYLEGITQNEYGYPPMLFSRARCFSGAAFGLMYQDRTVPFFVEAQNECIDLWTSRTDDEEAVPQSLSLTTEESEIVAQYGPDLATFISEEIPKFVTGARDLATWGDFMATVEDMHVAELTEVYQAAYDRYFEN